MQNWQNSDNQNMANKYEYEEVTFDDKKTSKKRSSKKKKATGIGVAIYLLILIVLFILFAINLPQLKKAWTTVTSDIPPAAPVIDLNEIQEESTLESDLEEKTVTITVETEREILPSIVEEEEVIEKEIEREKEEIVKEENKENDNVVESKTKTVTTQVKYTELQLCFIEIDANGTFIRRTIKRSVPKNDSPLTTAINLLIQGPEINNAAEKKCMSFIPKGTKLLSAKVSNGIAYLNFNDAFAYNYDGIEAGITKLIQIVYTATSFSTVSGVQISIEGEVMDELGGDYQIRYPLTRNSF